MRITNNDFRDKLETSKYPFSDSSTLLGSEGYFIPETVFVDGFVQLRNLSSAPAIRKIRRTLNTLTIYIGDEDSDELAYGSLDLSNPEESIQLVTSTGVSAGVLVVDTSEVSIFAAWPNFDIEFEPAATQFVPTCFFSIPDYGVSGFLTPDGEFHSGTVMFYARNGIQFEQRQEDGNTNIYVVATGDPALSYASTSQAPLSPAIGVRIGYTRTGAQSFVGTSRDTSGFSGTKMLIGNLNNPNYAKVNYLGTYFQIVPLNPEGEEDLFRVKTEGSVVTIYLAGIGLVD